MDLRNTEYELMFRQSPLPMWIFDLETFLFNEPGLTQEQAVDARFSIESSPSKRGTRVVVERPMKVTQ
jgi:hypothetical protein